LMGIELLEMERRMLAQALQPWPMRLRTLDALHLGSADYLRRKASRSSWRATTAGCWPRLARLASRLPLC